MDIQICQCCGIIIRGKSKFCTGCGTTISKFSPVTLPVISHTAAPLAVKLDPDPLVLERTMVKVRYGNMPAAAPSLVPGGTDGNGHDGNGGGNGNGHAPEGNGQVESPGQAAAASTSKLQNILGSAARGLGGGNTAGMISYDGDPDDLESGAMPAPQPEPVYASEVQPLAPDPIQFAPSGEPPVQGVPVNEAPQGISPKHSATFNRIVTNAGAFDALAGSTVAAAVIPVTVTTALSPGLDAGAVLATNLDATPSMVPITSAEAPVGSPTAASLHATTVVAPATGSPENIPMEAPGERKESIPKPPAVEQAAAAAETGPVESETPPAEQKPPLVFQSPQSSPAPSVAEAAPSAVPDFFSGGAVTEPAPATVPATEPAPPLTSGEAPSPVLAPASVADLPTENAPPLTVQGPEIAPPAAPVQSAVAIAQSPAALDFFAAQDSNFPIVSAPTAAEFTPPKSGGIVIPEKSDKSILDTAKFSNGVPSVVQDAIRAAASASQTKMASLSAQTAALETDDGPKTRVISDGDEELSEHAKPKRPKKRSLEEDSDDSDKPKKSKSKSKDRSASGMRAKTSKRDDDDDSEEDDRTARDSEKSFGVGGVQMKKKTALIAGILAVFLGFPITMFIFGAIGKAVSSAGAGGGGASYAIMGGDWSMGVLLPNGNNLKATVNLQQSGSAFSGNGVDTFGYFMITNGNVAYTQDQKQKVQFSKVYIDDQRRPKGKPITYIGVVDWVNPDPSSGKMPFLAHMYGKWVLEKRQGYGWRGQIVKETGDWEAGEIRVDKNSTAGGGPSIPTPGAPDIGEWIRNAMGFPSDGSPAKMAGFFARIAGFLLLIGMALVFASIKFFGPAGMLNIWAKKEYIPSQFKSQHFKMVSDFGKPIKAGGLPLGWRADWNITKFWLPQKLALPPEVRAQNPHVMVLGAGSKGKSRLIASMIHQDIESNDRAVVVIDSDGALIDLLMAKIAASPKGNEIAKRLIVIDPTHGGDVLAYNPLEYPEDGDLQNAASAVVFGFKAIYTEPPGAQSQWNQQTANILRNAAILLMANGKTLTDLPVLLSENDFRDVLLEKVERLKTEKAEFTTLLEAWAQYKRLARTDQWINWVEPILNRVQPMLGDPRIRPILTKAKGDLNLKEIISEGKILFVKVPQGQLDQNANLLGSLIVTGVKQAAMSLSLKGSSRKHQCSLYLDEFDSFIEKETFDAITSETKKFQIGFVGSSKTLQGLPEDYRNQIIINVGTMCCFALAKKDGDILGPSMFRVDGRKIKHQTLQNIFNKVNTAPQFELISDEEKLNIDRVVGQEERHYFCYRVGTVAGVFQMRAPDFNDVPDKDVNWTLIDQVYARSVPKE